MHKNDLLKHKPSEDILRLVKLRDNGINTYIQVDENGNPIIKKRSWSVRPEEQLRIVKGFDNLEIVKTLKT